jgi:hypothetical protein
MIDTNPKQRTHEGGASRFDFDHTATKGRYMHLQLTPKMWMELEEKGDISALRHWHLRYIEEMVSWW